MKSTTLFAAIIAFSIIFVQYAPFSLAQIPSPGLIAPTLPPPPVPPPPQQFALDVCWGGIACMDSLTLTVKFNDAFFLAASLIALAVFLIGAFLMVISAGQDTLLQPAKRAMKGSLIGLAIIVGSYGIYRTVVFLLYP
jgi:hypothetical protein